MVKFSRWFLTIYNLHRQKDNFISLRILLNFWKIQGDPSILLGLRYDITQSLTRSTLFLTAQLTSRPTN